MSISVELLIVADSIYVKKNACLLKDWGFFCQGSYLYGGVLLGFLSVDYK